MLPYQVQWPKYEPKANYTTTETCGPIDLQSVKWLTVTQHSGRIEYTILPESTGYSYRVEVKDDKILIHKDYQGGWGYTTETITLSNPFADMDTFWQIKDDSGVIRFGYELKMAELLANHPILCAKCDDILGFTKDDSAKDLTILCQRCFKM